MAIFLLNDKPLFPPPHLADDDGLLAVGGDLRMERLLEAYSNGVFPWYSESTPILWWSPDPRLVLFPKELHISRSLKQVIKKGIFTITTDKAFEEVIKNCAVVHRKGSNGTWLTDEMINAYINLYKAGYAHSVESWQEGELAGGLYGVSLGGIFFGESMFAKISDASKAAFVKLVRSLEQWNYTVVDCQVVTGHLIRMGARTISRTQFLRILKAALGKKTARWGLGF